MIENEYLIFLFWCISIFIFYKILKKLQKIFIGLQIDREIDDFFNSYGRKNC